MDASCTGLIFYLNMGLKRKNSSKTEESSENATSFRSDVDDQVTMSNEEYEQNYRLEHKRVRWRGSEDEDANSEEEGSQEDGLLHEEVRAQNDNTHLKLKGSCTKDLSFHGLLSVSLRIVNKKGNICQLG